MDLTEQIFGIPPEREEGTAEQTAAAVESPSRVEAADVPNQTTPMTELANFVMARFKENADFRRRSGQSERLDYCIRAQTCSFTREQREKLVAGGMPPSVVDKVFAPITSTKIRAAKAMLVDLANQSGEPLFRLEASPSPEVPKSIETAAVAGVGAEIQSLFDQLAQSGVTELPAEAEAKLQRLVAASVDEGYERARNDEASFARTRAQRMERKVWDLMLEGGWNEAFYDYIDNLCTYGTGVVVGPVMRTVCANESVLDRKSGNVVKYRRASKTIPVFESVSPQDVYPAPDALDVGDGPLCIRVRYTADDLWRFSRGARTKRADGGGWMRDMLGAMLARHPSGGVRLTIESYDPERRWCERNGVEDTADCTFEGVRCFASVRGSVLAGMGIVTDRAGKPVRLGDYYRTESVVLDNRVVYCRICDDVEGVPVSRGRYYAIPGSWWGESIAEKVAMCQTVLNNAVKALLLNMPASSGAIYYIKDAASLANKSPDALKLKAGMTIPFVRSMAGDSGQPIGAVTVPSNASELLTVWKAMQTQADLDSGIPAYTEGQSSAQGGALRTAQGLAMFTEAQSRGMKMIMTSTDREVISTVVRRTADYVLVNDPDMSLKGDVNVRPVGLIGKILKAQRDQSRTQMLSLVVNNQFLLQLVGPKGVVALLRPSLQDLDINADDVLPSQERMNQLELVEGIKELLAATGQTDAQAQQPEAAGAPPGVSQPPQVEQPQGAVAERRGVA